MGKKSEAWHTIEGKHLGPCVWQQRGMHDTVMREGLIHRATGRILIVEKRYAARLPRENSSTPWPDLISVNVYAPVDGDGNTWAGLDAAIGNLHNEISQAVPPQE